MKPYFFEVAPFVLLDELAEKQNENIVLHYNTSEMTAVCFIQCKLFIVIISSAYTAYIYICYIYIYSMIALLLLQSIKN